MCIRDRAYFLFLPDGEDPDTIVRKEGAKGFDKRLGQATPLSEFFFAQISHEVDLTTPDGKSRLASKAQTLIKMIPEGDFRDQMDQLNRRKTSTFSFHADSSDYVNNIVEQISADQRAVSRGEIPHGYATVSYTHLDVYKRQVEHLAAVRGRNRGVRTPAGRTEPDFPHRRTTPGRPSGMAAQAGVLVRRDLRTGLPAAGLHDPQHRAAGAVLQRTLAVAGFGYADHAGDLRGCLLYTSRCV